MSDVYKSRQISEVHGQSQLGNMHATTNKESPCLTLTGCYVKDKGDGVSQKVMVAEWRSHAQTYADGPCLMLVKCVHKLRLKQQLATNIALTIPLYIGRFNFPEAH